MFGNMDHQSNPEPNQGQNEKPLTTGKIVKDSLDYNLKHDKKTKWRLIAGITALIVGILLIIAPFFGEHLVRGYQPKTTATTMAKNEHKKTPYDYQSIQKLSLANIAQARAHAKDLVIVGEIAIPADHIHIPIAKGISNYSLALAAGTFRPNMKMGQGNYALAGHNMGNGSKILFSPLYGNVRNGQKIYVTNLKHVYTYEVTNFQIIDPHQVNVVNDTPQKIITLITCNQDGSKRLMVRGKLIKSQKLKHAPKHVRKLFAEKFNQY